MIRIAANRVAVTPGLEQYIFPLHGIPWIPARSTDDYRLTFARSLHSDTGGPGFGIACLKTYIGSHANLCGKRKVTPRKTARNVIFIQNCGAMSQHETLDFKETTYEYQQTAPLGGPSFIPLAEIEELFV